MQRSADQLAHLETFLDEAATRFGEAGVSVHASSDAELAQLQGPDGAGI